MPFFYVRTRNYRDAGVGNDFLRQPTEYTKYSAKRQQNISVFSFFFNLILPEKDVELP
jgi:hypothetical protein